MSFAIQLISSSKRGAAKAYLLEDGYQVALVTKGARVNGWIAETKFKWYTERARRDFDDFCDSISMSEGVEALGFPV